MTAPDSHDPTGRRNRTVAIACASFACFMVGAAYASAPLYDLFCRVTGYGGTPQIVSGADGVQVLDRDITVRFDANVAPGLKWSFTPDQRAVTLKIGEMRTINYRAKNISDEPSVGTATFNVTPDASGAYFSKIACFCFTEQRLEPGEEIEMGVTFYVDPAIVDDADTASVKTITLSYTFFPAKAAEKPVAGIAVPADNKRL
ncbi:cytochrome c oxidase assembly protein [Chthonobacter rhizosphaerae]|uniref:cytochrome c oxidase assembly protein n=1 Tax=Chthonobacter rhizosphaerae TaxID=2735553 RepID=UPI0015EFA748|nr:cytochrome c oxidase assembly protein [Chthonobacter rhizosphaerae]